MARRSGTVRSWDSRKGTRVPYIRGVTGAGRALAATILVLFSLAYPMAAPARATTGPTQYLGLSRYHVPMQIARQWRGQYLVAQPQTAHLSGAVLGIEITPYGFLHGISTFYGYDAQGHRTSWFSIIYNFHLTSHDVMVADILPQLSKAIMGRLYLTRLKSGDLVGQIALLPKFARLPIHWHKLNAGVAGG
jgi:hypothetical protein